MYHVNPYAKSLHALSGPNLLPLQPKVVTSELYLNQPVKAVDTSLYLKPLNPLTAQQSLGPLQVAQQHTFDAQGLGPLQIAQGGEQVQGGEQMQGGGEQMQGGGEQMQGGGMLVRGSGQQAQGRGAPSQTSLMNSYPLYLDQQAEQDEEGRRFPSHYVPVDKQSSGVGLLALLGGLALLALNKR